MGPKLYFFEEITEPPPWPHPSPVTCRGLWAIQCTAVGTFPRSCLDSSDQDRIPNSNLTHSSCKVSSTLTLSTTGLLTFCITDSISLGTYYSVTDNYQKNAQRDRETGGLAFLVAGLTFPEIHLVLMLPTPQQRRTLVPCPWFRRQTTFLFLSC